MSRPSSPARAGSAERARRRRPAGSPRGSLASLLLHHDQPGEVLPPLHREALALLGGRGSVLFERSPRGPMVLPTSSVGVDGLRPDPWVPGRAEARLAERVFVSGEPQLIADASTAAPALAAYIGTPLAVLVPLQRRGERFGLLVVGLTKPPRLADLRPALARLADAFTLTLEYIRQRRTLGLQRDLHGLLQDF